MFKRKAAAFLLALSFIAASLFASSATHAETNIKVQYNGKGLTFPDQKPIIRQNRTLVPIRPIAEGLGFKVNWNGKSRTVSIVKGTNTVYLVVNSKVAKKNNQTITLDVPAQVVNGRTMVPVRFIAEALNYQVTWSAADHTVKITDIKVVQAALFDRKSISPKGVNFFGSYLYVISGRVEAGAQVTMVMNGETKSVPVKKDGTFDAEYSSEKMVTTFKLIATKSGKTDTYEGKVSFQ